MTTTKPPVLTDEQTADIYQQFQIVRTNMSEPAGFAIALRIAEQAVLARAGADAVRNQALEEAASITDAEAENSRQERYYPGVVGMVQGCSASIRALKVTPAAAVTDAQPVAWPEADAENAAIGWTLDFKFVEQVREVAAMGYGFSAGQEEAEAILMAALSVRPLYAAPQAGQLSGNAGEVDVVEIPLPSLPPSFDSVWMLTEGGTDRYPMYTASQMEEFARAAIAASKGASNADR